jgi:hypothetical protein
MAQLSFDSRWLLRIIKALIRTFPVLLTIIQAWKTRIQVLSWFARIPFLKPLYEEKKDDLKDLGIGLPLRIKSL